MIDGPPWNISSSLFPFPLSFTLVFPNLSPGGVIYVARAIIGIEAFLFNRFTIGTEFMEGETGTALLMLWPLGAFGLVRFESKVLDKSRPDRVGNGFFSLSLPTIGGRIGADLSRVVDIFRVTWVWVGIWARPDRSGIEAFLDIPN